MDAYFHPVIFAAAAGGAGCGVLGVFVVGMRIPFIGVFISHAAMAGAVAGAMFGLPPMPCALAFSMAAAAGVSVLAPGRSFDQSDMAMSVAFAFMMGVTFLCIGLSPSARTPMLDLLWGSVLFVSWRQAALVCAMTLAALAVVAAFDKELRVMLQSRLLAAASGIHEGFVWTVFLVSASAIISVNIDLVGGLMLFSLLTCPAAAAFQLCRGYVPTIAASAALGALCGAGGFLCSYWLEAPTGACICLASCGVLGVCAALRRMSPGRG